VGRATALSSYVTDADKSYIARVRLGLTTDTEDITGEVLRETEVSVTEEELLAAANAFLGKIMQVPPMYSAISQNGVRLYKLAREGKTVEREAREIEIKKIEVSDFDGRDFTLSVSCSKGTYIRSLCRDIGEKLGCGATLFELLRTETAGFSIENAVALEDLSEENIAQYLNPADLAVAHLPVTSVTEKQAIRFSNGGELDLMRIKGSFSDGQLVRVKFGEILLGLGIVLAERGILKVECVINDAKGSDCGA
jgi:tRNA pseudouridine55 synthase